MTFTGGKASTAAACWRTVSITRKTATIARLTVREVAETWQNFGAKNRHDSTLLAFGYGDGGGGPGSEMMERFARLREFPGLPRLRMGGVAEFYEGIRTESLPVWVASNTSNTTALRLRRKEG